MGEASPKASMSWQDVAWRLDPGSVAALRKGGFLKEGEDLDVAEVFPLSLASRVAAINTKRGGGDLAGVGQAKRLRDRIAELVAPFDGHVLILRTPSHYLLFTPNLALFVLDPPPCTFRFVSAKPFHDEGEDGGQTRGAAHG